MRHDVDNGLVAALVGQFKRAVRHNRHHLSNQIGKVQPVQMMHSTCPDGQHSTRVRRRDKCGPLVVLGGASSIRSPCSSRSHRVRAFAVVAESIATIAICKSTSTGLRCRGTKGHAVAIRCMLLLSASTSSSSATATSSTASTAVLWLLTPRRHGQ